MQRGISFARFIRPNGNFKLNRLFAEKAPQSVKGETPVEEAGEVVEKVVKEIEIGGPEGPEPTRYGDYAFKGRCSDF